MTQIREQVASPTLALGRVVVLGTAVYNATLSKGIGHKSSIRFSSPTWSTNSTPWKFSKCCSKVSQESVAVLAGASRAIGCINYHGLPCFTMGFVLLERAKTKLLGLKCTFCDEKLILAKKKSWYGSAGTQQKQSTWCRLDLVFLPAGHHHHYSLLATEWNIDTARMCVQLIRVNT